MYERLMAVTVLAKIPASDVFEVNWKMMLCNLKERKDNFSAILETNF